MSEKRAQDILVGRGGFEPPKAMPADLQSAPFGRSGTDPLFYLIKIYHYCK